jgi:hypothetical protein
VGGRDPACPQQLRHLVEKAVPHFARGDLDAKAMVNGVRRHVAVA